MRKNAISLFAAAVVLALASGCSCVTSDVRPCPGDSPAPLSDSARSGRQSGLPGKKAASEVRSDLVYNLGDNVFANTLAVTMAGGYERPRPTARPVGADSCCGPAPQQYYEAVAANQNRPYAADAAPLAKFAAADMLPDSESTSLDGAGHVSADAVPAGLGDSGVEAGTTVSELFTLTDEELRNGPDVYYPGFGKFGIKMEENPEAPVADAVLPPAPATAPEMPEVREEERVSVLIPAAHLVESVVPAGASLTTTTEPSLRTDKYAAMNQPLPQVPTIADLEGAAEAILARDAAAASSLPAVELPPKLN